MRKSHLKTRVDLTLETLCENKQINKTIHLTPIIYLIATINDLESRILFYKIRFWFVQRCLWKFGIQDDNAEQF